MAALLSIRSASKTFTVGEARVVAVDDVSLDVQSGETLAIVGESGSGKTTLANLILSIETPSAGEIFLAGEKLERHRSRDIRRRIGLVQQNPYSALNPRKRIGETINLPLVVHKIGSRRERRARVQELLECVGLSPELAARRPLALSGGQRQRVAIARALATHPELLVLDEPTSSLDVSVQANILQLLRQLQSQLGLTFIFIAHDLGVVRVIASRVAVMYRGRVVEEGPTEAIFRSPRHRYTNLLLASIPTVSPDDDAFKPDWPWDQAIEATSAIAAGGCAFRARCPFAQPRCAAEVPELQTDGDHRHACFNAASHGSQKDASAAATILAPM